MIKTTSANAIKEIGKALAKGEPPPEIMVTRVDAVPHVYVLAKFESVFNKENYYDEKNDRGDFKRTDVDKQFNIFSGKAAELELQRRLENKNLAVLEGTRLFCRKPDDGVDQKYDDEQFGSVQVKFRRGRVFSVDGGTLCFCAENKCTLAVVRCDGFYNDYKPKNGDANWREPPTPPVISYKDWYTYKVDATKAVLNGKREFNVDDVEYVSWI